METRNVVYPISVMMLVQVGNILAVPVPQGMVDREHAEY